MKIVHDWKYIEVTTNERVTELTLHDGDGGPLIWNATVHRELAELFTLLPLDLETSVILLTGTGEEFCTRVDSSSFRAVNWHAIAWEGRRLVSALVDLDVPVVSAINGPLHMHSEVAILADIVLATPTVTFADHLHFTRGIAPGDGIQLAWQALIGPTRANYFLLTGSLIDAEEALRLGVVHEIVPAEDLLDRAREHAHALARVAPEVLRSTRAAFWATQRSGFRAALEFGITAEALAIMTQGTAGSKAPGDTARSKRDE
jgi:enoyl-CoA hydratase/carnithine racemase